jgi:hypothetical protein
LITKKGNYFVEFIKKGLRVRIHSEKFVKNIDKSNRKRKRKTAK